MARNLVYKYSVFFVVITSIACFSKKRSYEALRIRGSDSEVNVAQALAESYMDIDDAVSIGVTGGGSGAGIAALINNKTDLANSSRSLTKEEMYYASKRGVKPMPIIFALDAIAIIVHKDNPIDEISMQQLSQIYNGKLRDWILLNAGHGRITLYGRQSSSGTFLYFRDHVVKDEYCHDLIGMNGTSQIVEALKTDKFGIGYVSSGYLSSDVLKHIKVVAIKKTIRIAHTLL